MIRCEYCGQKNKRDKQHCGEDVLNYGCGAPLPDEAIENRMSLLSQHINRQVGLPDESHRERRGMSDFINKSVRISDVWDRPRMLISSEPLSHGNNTAYIDWNSVGREMSSKIEQDFRNMFFSGGTS